MAFKEALFWFGLTMFGTGLYFTAEKGNVSLAYAIVLMVFGLGAMIYPVVRHHYPQMKLPAIRAWALLLVMTWGAIGFDIYARHVEKPKIVEKIVEKLVPQECPKQPSKKTGKDAAKQPTPTQSQAGKYNTQTGSVTQNSQPTSQDSKTPPTAQTSSPKPVYIPGRNDYSCPDGWTPAGAWGANGVPVDPYRGIGCKRVPE
jgi:hypothetical protein